jgi:prepilin-type N-terminal cleavage/methylation domain-containing protein
MGRTRYAGFTLVEMLVVIAIIAILASIFLVGLRGFREGAYDSRRASDLRNAQNYLELYYNRNRSYPNVSTWAALEQALINAQIGVSSIPHDPLSNGGTDVVRDYLYAASADQQQYVLRAQLNTDSQLLEDDADGLPHNIDCSDAAPNRYYCIAF